MDAMTASQSCMRCESWTNGMIAEDDDENYVYLQEGDLDNILEEDDVIAAVGSYQEIRRAVKDQQKGRRASGRKALARQRARASGREFTRSKSNSGPDAGSVDR